MTQYIYLLIEREFISLKENVYKIGKTTRQPEKRMAEYPKGSEVLLLLQVKNCHLAEAALINVFKKKFEQMPQYGTEYFKGDSSAMINEINAVINNIESNTRVSGSIHATPKKDLLVKKIPQNKGEKSDESILSIMCKRYVYADNNFKIDMGEKFKEVISMWSDIFLNFTNFRISEDKFVCNGEYYYSVTEKNNELFRLNILDPVCYHNKFTNITLFDKKTIIMKNAYVFGSNPVYSLCKCSGTNIVGEICYEGRGKELLCMVESNGKKIIISEKYPDTHADFWEELYGRENLNCTKCEPYFLRNKLMLG